MTTLNGLLEFHDAANIFPMDDEHIEELAADIETNGLQVPIETLDGKIIDGRRRYMACRSVGVTPQFKAVKVDDPVAYVLSLNLHRRHLTPSQLSMVGARAATLREKVEAEADKRMKSGKKNPMENLPQGKPISYRASFYSWVIPRITEFARLHGYAIGVHGSLHRDLDLIAVPWVDGATSPEALVEGLRLELNGVIVPHGTKGGRFDPEKGEFVEAIIENPSRKPHGRLAWNIHFEGGDFVDISVMPRIEVTTETDPDTATE